MKHCVTYSSSVTFTLTHDCPWHCGYCGFRTDNEGLITQQEINRIIAQGKKQEAKEALLISGERPQSLKHIRKQLFEYSFRDFIEFACDVAQQAIDAGFLPHGNYGALKEEELERLRPYHVSMGVMLENVVDDPRIAPEKKSIGRLKTIEAAGKLKIPFTSGILIGLGESKDSRFRSLDALAEIHSRYGHLQEILIQNAVPNGKASQESSFQELQLEDFMELIAYWKKCCSEVAIQIPPNLNPYWEKLLPYIDDLGGISLNRDEVNQSSPWQKMEAYRKKAQAKDVEFVERFAVYEKYCNEAWLDSKFIPIQKQHRLQPLN